MKYHMSEDRVARPCSAPEGECPLGGEHYSTEAEATSAIEERYSEELFPSHSRLVVNTLDEAFEDNVDPDLLQGGETMEEAYAVDEQTEIEEYIRRHKSAISKGIEPHDLKNLSTPLPVVKVHGDEVAVHRAWMNQDYDEVRLLTAKAIARKNGAVPGTFRITPEDVARLGQERYDPRAWT